MESAKFIQYADGSRRKYIFTDKTTWIIIIPSYQWSPKASRSARYWITEILKGNQNVFKYGEVINVNEPIQNHNQCCICKQQFPNRRFLVYHAKRCQEDITSQTEIINQRNYPFYESALSPENRHLFYKTMIEIYQILLDCLETKKKSGDKFIQQILKMKILWKKLQEQIRDPSIRIDLWEDVKTMLLDKQLEIEQHHEL